MGDISVVSTKLSINESPNCDIFGYMSEMGLVKHAWLNVLEIDNMSKSHGITCKKGQKII